MSFKVGDTVTIINPTESGWVAQYVGKSGTISKIYRVGWDREYRYRIVIGSFPLIHFYKNELELVNKNKQLTFIFHD
jgi:hypothetical protein